MPLNANVDLQNIDRGERLGDIKDIASGISEAGGISTQDSIAASTTQTQAGGTQIARACIRVTSAAANDAITLKFTAQAGRAFVILNDSGQTIRLFPYLGDKINDAATNALVSIANNTMSEYFCPVDGLWFGGATTFEA